MITKWIDCLKMDPAHPERWLRDAADCLRDGGLVAFPTETVYGLGGNAYMDTAVSEIYRVKGRPQDNPLIVHLSRPEDLDQVAMDIPEEAEKLFAVFSPGPLTLVLRRNSRIPKRVSAGLDTVAVRIPDHPIASALIRLSGVPVVAPSANLSGKPSPTRAWHVRDDMDGKIPYILEGGPCRFGVESTVLDLNGEQISILRPGAITQDMLEKVLKRHVYLPGERKQTSAEEPPRAPGMKYRHYAPKARVKILEESDKARLEEELREALSQEGEIAFYLSDRTAELLRRMGGNRAYGLITFGEGAAPASAGLFDAFRRFDELGVERIYVEALSDRGEGLAYMNRLRKAAADKDRKPN